MKKQLSLFVATLATLFLTLAFAAQAQQHHTLPSYDELKTTGYNAFQNQDYKTTYQTFHTMDSVYGITDYLDLVYYSSLTDRFNSNSEESKALMFRIARNKCCDMKFLEEMVEKQKADTLDHWGEIVAIVSPRGVQDSIYQDRLLTMKRSYMAALDLLNNGGNDSAWSVFNEVNVSNAAELQQLIAERGFPTYTRVGYYCNDYASVLAYFLPTESLQWYLEQAKAAADTGDFDLTWIAYMTDRDLEHQGKPQLYGTQLHGQDGITALYPIADIEHLAERRERAHLGPIENYLASYDLPETLIHPALVNYNQYSLTCHIDGDTMRVSGTCYFSHENNYRNHLLLSQTIRIDSLSMDSWQRNGDTITFAGHPVKADFAYNVPLADFRASDGAIVLRREGNWYPYRNSELLTANVRIEAEDYYLIGGTVMTPAYELHLILLPKENYTCKVLDSPTRPFLFYRTFNDTTSYSEEFYNEFMDSYGFYSSFFSDSLSQKPMNIVEIGDPQFVMCQSLRDMIIFGHYFYDVYTMMPDFSWIPHEVAHQWWGNSLFFGHRDYALSESLDEYIKLQFLKSRKRGYKEQMSYYKYTMKLAEKRLPIADIRSVELQDASIAIYNTAPYRLEKSNYAKVDDLLQQLYQKHKNTVVSREVFLRECGR